MGGRRGGKDLVDGEMVTGVEEEMKVTSNDERNNKINQLKPVKLDFIKSTNHSLFISPFPRLNSPE